MFKIIQLLIAIIMMLPGFCFAGDGYEYGNGQFPNKNKKLGEDTESLCHNCSDTIRSDNALNIKNDYFFCDLHCLKGSWNRFRIDYRTLADKMQKAIQDSTNKIADLNRNINDLRSENRDLKIKDNGFEIEKNDLKLKIKKLKERNESKDLIISLCAGGLCAAYVYKNCRFFQDMPLFLNIPGTLLYSALFAGIPLLYPTKQEIYGIYRFFRGAAWFLVAIYSAESPKESGPFFVPLLSLIAGVTIMDQVAVRVDRYLDKKKIKLPFDIIGVAGTIAMIRATHLPWSKISALLGEK